MRLFGKPKQPPSPADAIQRLRETLDLLEKREKYLEKKIDSELALAKKNAKSNKRGTLNQKTLFSNFSRLFSMNYLQPSSSLNYNRLSIF